MDTVTYPEPRVAHFLNQYFIPVKVRIKEDPKLAGQYLVSWTPNVVLADAQGRIHHRVDGYLPPEDFLACLALGVGRYLLNRERFAQAAERFEEVAQRHQGSDAGAEALYWLGVARYKQSDDVAQLRPSWQRLAREYPNSAWTRRSQIPATS